MTLVSWSQYDPLIPASKRQVIHRIIVVPENNGGCKNPTIFTIKNKREDDKNIATRNVANKLSSNHYIELDCLQKYKMQM